MLVKATDWRGVMDRVPNKISYISIWDLRISGRYIPKTFKRLVSVRANAYFFRKCQNNYHCTYNKNNKNRMVNKACLYYSNKQYTGQYLVDKITFQNFINYHIHPYLFINLILPNLAVHTKHKTSIFELRELNGPI